MNSPRLFFVAAEASGDLLGRETIDAVRARRPDAEIAGVGGAEMAAAGVESPFDISALSVLGFVEGLRAYGDVVRLADEAVDAALDFEPGIAILIDSWGFTLRVAQRLRARAPGVRIVKLIGPQVWATRPGRAKTLAATVDHLLCMHAFEAPYYTPYGLKTTVIGPPALSRATKGDGDAFRARHGLSPGQPMLLVLPGSRPGEIAKVAPVLMQAAKTLQSERPDLCVVAAPADSVSGLFARAFPDACQTALVIDTQTDRRDAMAAADLALACSGTVTTELAVQGAPMIVGYKTGWLTWAVARGLLYQKRHITLLNIASDDTEIVPEFVQTRFTPQSILNKARALLDDRAALEALRTRQTDALARLGGQDRPAAQIAADAILSDFNALSGLRSE